MRTAAVWFRALVLAALTGLCGPARSFTNVQVNTTIPDPEETSIAINPANPDNIVGVAQVPLHHYASFDGGVSWSEGYLNDPDGLGDPSVAFDRSQNAYFGYIGQWFHSGIFVSRSTDGGLSFEGDGTAVVEHVGSVPFEDKCYVACDRSAGAGAGNVYIAWTRFTEYGVSNPADSTWVYFSRSTDQAQHFSPPLRISDQGGDCLDGDNTVEGAVPAAGPDGQVYVAWAGPRGIEFDRSLDAGVTFDDDRVIASQPGGWEFEVPGILRAGGLPVTQCDISPGPYRGRVYVNWADQRHGDTDIFLIHSDDGGTSWSAPVRVNDDPIGNGAHQFFSWIDVDAITGYLYIVFYDRRAYPPQALDTDVYLAASTDGGESFTNIPVSAAPFVPSAAVFFGDYIGIAAYGGRVRPFWMRMDDQVLSVWTALVEFPAAVAETPVGPVAGRLQFAPSLARAGGEMSLLGLGPGLATVVIRDAQGRTVRALPARGGPPPLRWDGRDAAGRPLAGGIYWATAPGYTSARLILLR